MPPLTAPTFPNGTTATDLNFANLIKTMVIDEAYFGMGNYTSAEIGTKFASKTALATELSTYLKQIGELAEKPGKTESKCEGLKTRNYLVPGKRTNTMELTINGLSAKQKDFFESSSFSGQEVTIVGCNRDHDQVTIFNGMRWKADWSGEADGLWSVVLSTEFSGSTANKIVALQGLA